MSVTTREKYKSPDLEISRNFEPVGSEEGTDEAVYIWSGIGDWGKKLSTNEAREIAAALIEAADEFDEMLAEAKLPRKTAAVILVEGYAPFIKSKIVVDGDTGWVNSNSSTPFSTKDIIKMGEFEVLFEGVDD